MSEMFYDGITGLKLCRVCREQVPDTTARCGLCNRSVDLPEHSHHTCHGDEEHTHTAEECVKAGLDVNNDGRIIAEPLPPAKVFNVIVWTDSLDGDVLVDVAGPPHSPITFKYRQDAVRVADAMRATMLAAYTNDGKGDKAHHTRVGILEISEADPRLGHSPPISSDAEIMEVLAEIHGVPAILLRSRHRMQGVSS